MRAGGKRHGLGEVLPHGFTVERLNRTASWSARGSRWGYPPYLEKVDLARFAILEHLYMCPDHEDVRENGHPCNLLRIGQRAITQHLRDLGTLHGIAINRDGYETGDHLLKYNVYWTSTASPTRSPEDPVVDVMALRQIWPLLEPKYQRALLALAEHDTYDGAAQALDLAYNSVKQYVYQGREMFLWWWHQHEKPSGVWGVDQRRRRDNNRNIMSRTFGARKRQRLHQQRKAAGQTVPAAQIRAWAAANGVHVNERGRIAQEVINAYTRATTTTEADATTATTATDPPMAETELRTSEKRKGVAVG
ncbi:Lsr2 family DNA-binding protein [Phytohabitans houttuyneae]|uniref:Lsr2 family DNA-binding protein n=1 Tax=Phytohabitans houttuyneae TaxID=1076126 RepID=UPI0031EBD798